MKHSFTYKSTDDKKVRLDIFLSEQLSDLSRSQIKKLILNEGVTVNKKKPTVHQFLHEGDEISLVSTQHRLLKKATAKNSTLANDNEDKKYVLEIITATKDYAIINKPAGLLVHPASSSPNEITLVNLLLKRYPSLRKIGEDPSRSAIVHRIDRAVSGIMVIPRTFEFFEHIKKQFKLRRIEKHYTVLVHDTVRKEKGEIDFVIGRSRETGKMAARAKGQVGKEALTSYTVLERYRTATLLDIQIHTGRTHQIRTHVLALGHPVVGDTLYTTKNKKMLTSSRMMLHATSIGFFDTKNQWQSYTSDLPKDFTDLLATLKKT